MDDIFGAGFWPWFCGTFFIVPLGIVLAHVLRVRRRHKTGSKWEKIQHLGELLDGRNIIAGKDGYYYHTDDD